MGWGKRKPDVTMVADALVLRAPRLNGGLRPGQPMGLGQPDVLVITCAVGRELAVGQIGKGWVTSWRVAGSWIGPQSLPGAERNPTTEDVVDSVLYYLLGAYEGLLTDASLDDSGRQESEQARDYLAYVLGEGPRPTAIETQASLPVYSSSDLAAVDSTTVSAPPTEDDLHPGHWAVAGEARATFETWLAESGLPPLDDLLPASEESSAAGRIWRDAHGRKHRVFGPAVVQPGEQDEWWRDGVLEFPSVRHVLDPDIDEDTALDWLLLSDNVQDRAWTALVLLANRSARLSPSFRSVLTVLAYDAVAEDDEE